MDHGAAAIAASFDLDRARPRLPRRPLPDLPGVARARPGAPHAGRLVFPDPLRRSRRGLSRRQDLELGQDRPVQAELRRQPALRAPHHEPRVQRSADPHPRAQAACAPPFTPRALARACSRASRRWWIACSMHAAERGTHRPDRGFRRRDPGAADRRHARHSAGRARAAARLVAENPRCAWSRCCRNEQFEGGVTAVDEFKAYPARSRGAPPARRRAATPAKFFRP